MHWELHTSVHEMSLHDMASWSSDLYYRLFIMIYAIFSRVISSCCYFPVQYGWPTALAATAGTLVLSEDFLGARKSSRILINQTAYEVNMNKEFRISNFSRHDKFHVRWRTNTYMYIIHKGLLTRSVNCCAHPITPPTTPICRDQI
jgi:hypothetical protein